MPLATACPYCKTSCQVPESRLGAPVRCPQCGRQFLVQLSLPQAAPAELSRCCRLEIGAATSAGHVRKQNEDSYLVQHYAWSNLDQRHELALIVVADGVGGEQAGEQASGIVIRTIGQTFAPLLSGALAGQFHDTPAETLAETVDYAIHEAHRAVQRKAHGNAACKGMAATAAIVLIRDDLVLIGHVGDCRVYHRPGARLEQVTRDQTIVQRMVELRQLTPAEAATHPARHEVTQAIGLRSLIEPARHERHLEAGDWLLICCDGLHTQVPEDDLVATLSMSHSSAGEVAQHLIGLADEAGGKDNVTVVAVRCW
jgi:protein phosphatase